MKSGIEHGFSFVKFTTGCSIRLPHEGMFADSSAEELRHEARGGITLGEWPSERRVFQMLPGSDSDWYYMSLTEIAEELGCSRENVRIILKNALRKLRHPSNSRKLRYFLK